MAVSGLEVFARWFADHQDNYVLIGGAAADTVMAEEGIAFRPTKDLDVVLVVEALTPAFATKFWDFIDAGGYGTRQVGDSRKPKFYRFKGPADESFPLVIELFSRVPDVMAATQRGHLTPVPIAEHVSSLSAILLDDDYYHFILAHRRQISGVPLIDQECLIPLKAFAWLELLDLAAKGVKVDSRDIQKHFNDVFDLSALLSPESTIALPGRIAGDLDRFLDAARQAVPDGQVVGRSRVHVQDVLPRIYRAFGLGT